MRVQSPRIEDWSPRELAGLHSLRMAGVPAKEIGRRLGRTPSQLEHAVQKYGLPRLRRGRKRKAG